MNLATNRKAIRSLRVGIVPSSHVLELTVGATDLEDKLENSFRAFHRGGCRPLIIKGEWGTGKSNLLCYVREYSKKRNFAVSQINLNGRSSAINHPQRLYGKIVAELRVEEMQGKGIAHIFENLSPDIKVSQVLLY